MKKYLIILAGSPRGGLKTWKTLIKHVKEPLSADLAILCSDKWKGYEYLERHAKFTWIFKEYENYENYYSTHFKGTWRDYFSRGLDTGLKSSGMLHFVFKDMVKKKYLDIILKYDYIIYSRFDQYYIANHPKGVKDSILIPEGEDYFGICDRHALVPTKYIREFLGICEYVNSKDALNTKDDFLNCEVTFKNHLLKENIYNKVKRFPRKQFTTSLNGEHTNWRIAKYKVYFTKNLMIKYPDEFIDSFHNLFSTNNILFAFKNDLIMTLNYIFLKIRIILGKLINER